MIIWSVSLAILVYFVLMQVQLIVVMMLSGLSLRRHHRRTRYGRIDDMLSSDLSPPVSIIVPAYNEATGIVESVRSMTMLRYPRFEIIVVNDGSKDGTLDRLIEEFRMVRVTVTIRGRLETQPIHDIYRSTLPLSIVVVDKENGGKTDALNAGTNVARYPYVLLTDADVVFDGDCLLRAMRHVVEDRDRVVAVGGNIRPINGSIVNRGRVVETHMPKRVLERVQLLEYIRSFIGTRPGWSALNGLVLISGAFGIYDRQVMAAVGGFRKGHLGEDMDLTMRIHQHMRREGRDYRIVYAPDAVCWTEVPTTREVLRTQRIRWHRGLRMVISDFKHIVFNPRYGSLGMFTWPSFVLFEYVAPMVEVVGVLVLPVALFTGNLNLDVVVPLAVFAVFLGAVNSLLGLFLDEAYGYFNSPKDAVRLLWLVYFENLGIRQQTVLWRLRATFARTPAQWGDMKRRGVGNLR